MSTLPTPSPYSRTRRAAGLLLTAGILGRTEDGLADGFNAQLGLALENLEGILSDEGCAMSDVVRLVCYLTDEDQMTVLNELFSAGFPQPRPARTTVVVGALPGGALVELEATAVVAPDASQQSGSAVGSTTVHR
jgi:2-iminobutanoate/2-iminopropanoate deaminase